MKEETMDDWVDASRESSSMLLDNETEATKQKLSKANDHSSDIASKLLQGWTLLGECCPVCVTPLVRNRQKQMYCVSCSQWVLTEEQLAAKLQEQHVQDSPTTTTAPHASPPSETTAINPQAPDAASHGTQVQTAPLGGHANRGHVRVASLRDDAQNLDERSPKRLASTEFFSGTETLNTSQDAAIISPSGPSESRTLALPKVNSPGTPDVVLSNTLSTLYQKLEELRQATASCQDIRELNQLLGALGGCMQAIQQAQTLSATAQGLKVVFT